MREREREKEDEPGGKCRLERERKRDEPGGKCTWMIVFRLRDSIEGTAHLLSVEWSSVHIICY